jgi:hypothetical protein
MFLDELLAIAAVPPLPPAIGMFLTCSQRSVDNTYIIGPVETRAPENLRVCTIAADLEPEAAASVMAIAE